MKLVKTCFLVIIDFLLKLSIAIKFNLGNDLIKSIPAGYMVKDYELE